ncbi:1-hydroxycarotenoid 3,4-desaturase CrtD [Ideonella sp. DXS29W]|uniref:1-hydroxycarotenoid 3,4-desaturase CrtD n=1 Tax=Ideonella lacteola TaxID=2984193 RepID=A0ABU9BMU4_9BURK
MRPRSVLIVGAGVAGLVAALRLAEQGLKLLVLERGAAPGGKLRERPVGGRWLDSGPTVCTMRWVFDELFESVGERLEAHLSLLPAKILARHAWNAHDRLDLHADLEATVDAIGGFAGAAEARAYRGFCRRARTIHDALEQPFLRGQRTSVLGLVRRSGWRGLPGLARISPFARMWDELGSHFADPRLQQLFGRYATYCGSSPFQATATLMLVAHVERQGVWLVEGGMARIADVLSKLARQRGAELRCDADVAQILVERGRCVGVRLRDGEELRADAVVFNGDVAALAAGQLGGAAAEALSASRRRWERPEQRSLSALTWLAVARCEGFPLERHNVFFSPAYRAEFDDIQRHGSLPSDPSVYVCAQDRPAADASPPPEGERLLCLVNAPARGDLGPPSLQEIESCEQRVFQRLSACGLKIQPLAPIQRRTPADFARRFPATGGALYGPPSHGWQASFRRMGARHPLPGLYLAGGSTHPGPGVPMAALSGQRAAECLWEDLASTRP